MLPHPKRLRRSFRAILLLSAIAVVAAVGVNLWAWYQCHEADRLQNRYRFSQAYAHYTQALKVWRWSASLHFQAARTARRAGLYPQAEHHLAEYQRLQGDKAEAAVPLALERLLLQAQFGDLDSVEDVLWQHIGRKKPETPLILEALARGYSRVLRPAAAMRCVRRILVSDPDNIEALVLAGKIIERGGPEAEDVSKYYRRALELDPERDDARLSLAQLFLVDRAEGARAQFEFLRARQPDNVEVMLGLAQAQRQVGEPEQARALLEEVLAKEPHNTRAFTELGLLAKQRGALAEAESFFRKAIDADPANRDANYRLYQCLAGQSGKEKQAEEQLAVYERVDRDLMRLGTIATKEMVRNPKDPKLRCEIGTIYLRYGKADVGVRWLNSALNLDAKHQPSHQALYEYYRRIGDVENAEWHHARLSQTPASPSGASHDRQ
jgi:Tfp pilus assembly protein PilF